jgi:hypothetical protein
MAAPGTPKAHEMPSFSRTRTAASTARILAMAVSSIGDDLDDPDSAIRRASFQFFQNNFSFL